LAQENVSQSHIELLKNESSFLANTVKFDKIIVYNGDVPDLTPLVLNKEIDYLTHQFPGSSMKSFLDLGYKTIQLQGVDGIGMYFNGAVKSLGKKEVRQAIAYVIDRKKIAELALPGVTRGTKYVSGLGDLMTEKWVDTSKLTDYSVNLDKAKELLGSVGMKQKDGKWYQANGAPFNLTIQCPTSWSDASTAASEIAQQLTAFGINTVFEGIDPNSRQSNINEGNFELALSFFGTAQPHPMFAFETPLLMSNANVSKGLSYPMAQKTEKYGDINLEELIYASTKGWDIDKQKEIVEKIVLTINDTVPYLPIYSKWSTNLSSKGLKTDWGSDDSLYLNSPGDDNFAVIKILNGELKPIQ
jgi:peptide/nickel transport system substrate-binding protein